MKRNQIIEKAADMMKNSRVNENNLNNINVEIPFYKHWFLCKKPSCYTWEM